MIEIVTNIYRDGEFYDDFSVTSGSGTDAIAEAARWLGNVIDNDPSFANMPNASESGANHG